jgi:hypothetical protein
MGGINGLGSASLNNFIYSPSNTDSEWSNNSEARNASPLPIPSVASRVAYNIGAYAELVIAGFASMACMDDQPNKPTTAQTLNQDGGELPLSQPPLYIPDAGVNPQVVPDGSTILGETGSGGTIVICPPGQQPGSDPTKCVAILPKSDGGTSLVFDEVFFPSYTIIGTGSHFQESPRIPYSNGFTPGSGIQNLDLAVKIGLDSTQVQIPNTNPAKYFGCFDGLVRLTQLAPATIAEGGPHCTLPDYTLFSACPGTPGNNLNVYLADYKLTGKQYQNGQAVPISIEEATLSTQAGLAVGKGLLLGNVCGTTPNPFYINIPKTFTSDGTLTLDLDLHLFVEAMNKDPNGTFASGLRVSIVRAPAIVSAPAPTNNAGIDGGTK